MSKLFKRPQITIPSYLRVLLIAVEVILIGVLGYVAGHFLPGETGRYLSLDVLYCVPIFQTARLSAIRVARKYDKQTSTMVGIAVALVWSASEAAIVWPDFPLGAFVFNVLTRSVIFTVLARVVVKLWRERELAYTDTLTGLATRMDFLQRMKIEHARSNRLRRPYSLLYVDIDRFKALNDENGHHVGDDALRVIADILKNSIRKVDVAARFGGDEFILLLPDTDEASCDVLINRIEVSTKRTIEARSWPISVSIGKTTVIGSEAPVESVIQLADESMYAVKRMKKHAEPTGGVSR